ncbi:MAG TPA: type 4a pilus biogenesis protein PilO, partial [Candidatus Bathyarchaeia archaeon]|nr:type 4a pilus biogenesis protein PilO [Candidatus Bathyarchaeia archaeon]
MMKFGFQKSERRIFLMLVGLVFAYAVFSVGEYAWRSQQELDARIVQARAALRSAQGILLRSQKKGAVDENTAALYQQRDSDEAVRSQMMQFLQGLASEGAIRMVDVKPQPVRDQGFYKEFPMALTLEGSFVDIMRFFYQAENSSPKFRVQEFRFTQSRSAKSPLLCQT